MHKSHFPRVGQRYVNNKSGNFGIWFALFAFPLLALAGLLVDFQKANVERSNMKGALDMAALAAVANNRLSEPEKIAYAKQVFSDNFMGTADVELDIEIGERHVVVTGKGELETSLASAVGLKQIGIEQGSAAVMDKRNTICVLALAEDGEDRVSFSDNTEYFSPTCVVQANSNHAQAIMSTSSNAPVAKAFCSVGGAVGDFEPYAKGDCSKAEDPYKDRSVPEPSSCMPEETFSLKDIKQGQNLDEDATRRERRVNARQLQRLRRRYRNRLIETQVSGNRIADNRVLMPGTYCGGLTIDGKNVLMMPGNYIMKDGPFTVKNGADLFANNVTVILNGEESIVTIEEGATAYIKARYNGKMAGLAFFQDRANLPLDSASYPTGVSMIASGGELNVIGAMYFPTQALEVAGDSIIGARAPATSFIAHSVSFAGDTQALVRVDHVAAGLPPLLPLADDTARLIR